MSRTPTYTDPADRKMPHPAEIIAPGCGDPALLTAARCAAWPAPPIWPRPPCAPAQKTSSPAPAASASACTTGMGG